MTTSNKPREVLQISLGPTSNAVTAHLLNLQGLSCTADDALCDPLTTHYIENSTYVPRALLIDAGTSTVSAEDNTSTFLQDTKNISTWHGNVQVLGNTNSHAENPFLQTASTLAYSPYSRYHVDEKNSGAQYNTSLNSRHVVWDDDEEEVDEEEKALRQAQQRKAKTEWTSRTAPTLGKELDAKFQPPTHWTDILMPPYANSSKITLPFSHQSQLVPHWDAGRSDLMFLQEWKEDVLSERLRHLLEPCDYGVQGTVITTEGCGLYASLTRVLLEELQEECKSATRWVNQIGVFSDASPSERNWQEFQVARVRQNISSGLALYDFTEQAHAVLPLRVDTSNLFRSSARVAMALEACGLPYRLSNGDSPNYKMGLQNAPFLGQGGSDTAWGSTANRLSMTEYLTILQPSSQYSMLEMDVLSNDGMDNQGLYNAIRQGTSVEQDQRMRQRGEGGMRGRPQDVAPGAWLQDSASNHGLLSSLSYSSKDSEPLSLSRSVHHHFALSTAIRPKLAAAYTTMRDYLTCLVQGMGIRYRPERSMATIMDQTLGSLTFGDGANYGAGVCWKHLLPSIDTPIVAVLGNTTRAFSRLDRIATDMKTTIRSSRFHGYVSRDVMNGVLPEMDDCEEALEGCCDKRDLYHPPEGRGFEGDDLDL